MVRCAGGRGGEGEGGTVSGGLRFRDGDRVTVSGETSSRTGREGGRDIAVF